MKPPPAKPPWPNPFEPSKESNERAANESALPPRMPLPPKTDVPKRSKPPSSKLGISDAFDPMSELVKPERPKAKFPKSEPPKPELPKRKLPKFAIERPEENDENDENRDDPGIFVEKRFALNPRRGACVFDAVAWLAPEDENPETFVPNEAFLEFPNERHWPSARTELP